MASSGSSGTILEAELKEYNPGIPPAASPHLLSPTVALLLFPCESEIPTSVLAFATYRRLADYNTRPPLKLERTRDSQKDKDLSHVRNKGKQTATGKEEKVMVPEDRCNWAMEAEGLLEKTVMQGG